MLDPLAVAVERGLAIEAVHGEVECAVGAAQVGGHDVGIVEVCQGRACMDSAGVQNRLPEDIEAALVGVG